MASPPPRLAPTGAHVDAFGRICVELESANSSRALSSMCRWTSTELGLLKALRYRPARTLGVRCAVMDAPSPSHEVEPFTSTRAHNTQQRPRHALARFGRKRCFRDKILDVGDAQSAAHLTGCPVTDADRDARRFDCAATTRQHPRCRHLDHAVFPCQVAVSRNSAATPRG